MDVRRSVLDPGFDARVNVVGTVNVLEAVRRGAPEAALVFTSTGGAIYGEGEGRDLPFGEEAAVLPEAPYGQSKLAGEGYVGFYQRVHGLAAASLRLGNVYGPRQDPRGRGGRGGDLLRAPADGGRPDGIRRRRADPRLRLRRRRRRRLRGAPSGSRPARMGSATSTTSAPGARQASSSCPALAAIGERDDFEPEMAPARAGEIQRCAIDPGKAGADLGWHAETGVDEGLRITLNAV